MEQSRNYLKNGKTPGSQNRAHFETDIAKIVRRHLADRNDVITDDDIRNVRISTDLPPFNEVTTGAEAAISTLEEEKQQPSDRPVNPWDTVA